MHLIRHCLCIMQLPSRREVKAKIMTKGYLILILSLDYYRYCATLVVHRKSYLITSALPSLPPPLLPRSSCLHAIYTPRGFLLPITSMYLSPDFSPPSYQSSFQNERRESHSILPKQARQSRKNSAPVPNQKPLYHD